MSEAYSSTARSRINLVQIILFLKLLFIVNSCLFSFGSVHTLEASLITTLSDNMACCTGKDEGRSR